MERKRRSFSLFPHSFMSHQRRLRFFVSSTNHQPQSRRGAGAHAAEARGDHQPSGGAADLPEHALEIVLGAGHPLQCALVRHEAAVRIGGGQAFADRLQHVGARLAPGIDRQRPGRSALRENPWRAPAPPRPGADACAPPRPAARAAAAETRCCSRAHSTSESYEFEPLHRGGGRPAAQRVDERQHPLGVDRLGRQGGRLRPVARRRGSRFGHCPDCRAIRM